VIVWHSYLAEDQLRLEQAQDRFLSYVAFTLKIGHAQHDYSTVLRKLNIPTLSSRRINVATRSIRGLLDGFINSPYPLLSSINFRIPTYPSLPFYIPSHSTSYGHNYPVTPYVPQCQQRY